MNEDAMTSMRSSDRIYGDEGRIAMTDDALDDALDRTTTAGRCSRWRAKIM
jgi:hypothetical protein